MIGMIVESILQKSGSRRLMPASTTNRLNSSFSQPRFHGFQVLLGEKEMTVAMQRHEAGGAIVIPIIVRDCDWESAPFGKLEALPEKGKAITRWSPQDSGWRNVAKGFLYDC